jgi:ATP-dependent helicase/nuclease subunit B
MGQVNNFHLISPQVDLKKGLRDFLINLKPDTDFSSTYIISSTARSNRLIQQELILHYQEKGLMRTFEPPHFLTMGRLAENFLNLPDNIASTSTAQLAWQIAIDAFPKSKCEKVLGVSLETINDKVLLSEEIAKWHHQLAAECCDPEKISNPQFDLLNKIRKKYLSKLQEADLCDYDLARLEAIKKGNTTIDSNSDVILAFVPELNKMQKKIIHHVKNQLSVIQIDWQHINSPYDEYGCIKASAFTTAGFCLKENYKLHFADDPRDAVDIAFSELEKNDSPIDAKDIKFSLLEKHCKPHLEQILTEQSLDLNYSAGESLFKTGPIQLLSKIKLYIDNPNFQNGYALLSHPEFNSEANLKKELDEDRAENYPQRLRKKYREQLPAIVLEKLNNWHKIVEKIGSFFSSHYDSNKEIYDDIKSVYQTNQSLDFVSNLLFEMHNVPKSLVANTSITISQVIGIILSKARQGKIKPRPGTKNIMCVDWLELLMDNTPHLFILGVNERNLPAQVANNIFISEELRNELNFDGDEERIARDSYLLQKLCSRQNHTAHLVILKHQNGNKPMVPSRLLFLDKDDVALTTIKNFVKDAKKELPPTILDRTKRKLPRSTDEPHINKLSVTQLSSYLDSPYLFYLRHILGLKDIDTNYEEINPLHYGTFTHAIIEAFSDSERKNSRDSKEIKNTLNEIIAIKQEQKFPFCNSIQKAQINLLKKRLAPFCNKQAQLNNEGWQIWKSEWVLPEGLRLFDSPFTITGTIDRIDIKDDTARIIDFKTSKSSEEYKVKNVFKQDSWRNLQLPLYALLCKELPDFKDKKIEIAYFPISEKINETALINLPWDEQEQNTAQEQIKKIIGSIKKRDWFEIGNPKFTNDTEQALIGKNYTATETIKG